jgi:hypothetical protein
MKTIHAQPSVSTPWEWRDRKLALHARLGEVTVARFPLRLRVREATLVELIAGSVDPLVALPSLASDADGFLVRCAPAAGPARSLVRRDGWLVYRQPVFERRYFSFEGGHDAYLKRFSSKTLSTIRRKVKKLSEAGGGRTDFRVFEGVDGIREFYSIAREVSSRSYQERLLEAGFPDTPDFRALMDALAEQGNALGYVMYLEGRPVAYLYCPVYDATVIYDYLGYDPEASRMSPGTVLLWLAIEELYRRNRFAFFDFGEGDSDHKRMFSLTTASCQNVYLLRRSIRNEAIVSAHRMVSTLSNEAGRSLERLGLKGRLRAAIRARVRTPSQPPAQSIGHAGREPPR